MSWFSIVMDIVVAGGAIFGIYWAWKNEYISWEQIKNSVSLEGLKDTVLTIVSEPTFIFLYLVFVFVPIWILASWLHIYDIPLYQKIILSVGGIWGVNQVMIGKGLK